MNTTTRILFFTLTCASLACGEGSGTPMGDMDASVPIEGRPIAAADLCTEISRIVCAANDACCDGVVAGEELTCVEQQVEGCERSLQPLLEDPRTAYVPERGGAFLDALKAKADGCFAEPPRQEDFFEVFEGTGVADADCTPRSLENADLRVAALSCQDGLDCHLYRRSDGSTLGVCEPREDSGCSHRFDCESGEWCSLPSEWEPGRWGECRPLKAEGWDCTSDLECASAYCDGSRTCAAPNTERYCAATTYPGVVEVHQPVGYWRLGDVASGVARDESGNALDGETGGSPTSATGALVDQDNGAMALDGMDDVVLLPEEVGELLSDGELSMEVWFRRDAESVAGPLLEFRVDEEERGTYLWNHSSPDRVNANFVDRSGENHSVMAPEGTIAADTWYHVVATYDGEAARLFVDGERVGEVLMGSWRPNTAGFLRIALREDDERHVTGAIDEVAVYDRALTGGQIRQHHSRGAEGPAAQDFVLFRWLR
ncbi:MAG: LamG domain-containing protein [Deltaproteobacteria bacterium]|nr:LamG domain-containing protein [Deltaproteobacteria bacterium]